MCDILVLVEKQLSSLVGNFTTGFTKCRGLVEADYLVHCDESAAALILPGLRDSLGELGSLLTDCGYEEKRRALRLRLERGPVFKLAVCGHLSQYLERFKPLDQDVKISCTDVSSEDLSTFRMQTLYKVLVNCVTRLSSPKEDKSVVELLLTIGQRSSTERKIPVALGLVRSNSKLLTLKHYHKLRKEEIVDMCSHKLDVNSEVGCVDQLLDMALIYDMLHTNIHKQLSFNFDTSTSTLLPSTKGALFIVYNYVRLTMVLSAFERKVVEGVYPPLPPLSHIDFTLLKSEEEWCLMLDYILMWPTTVMRAVEGLPQGHPKIHHLFTFLSGLATSYSHYYHRTRILVEGRKHLLPVIYSRIYLLMALQKVYSHALQLINIQPPLLM